MNPSEIKLLGEAIAQNAQFLSDLDYVELDPLERTDLPRNIGLLKNARVVDEVEDGYFYPGENYELLKKAIGSSRYEADTTPDIAEWLERLSFYVANFFDSLSNDDDAVTNHKRQIYRHIRQLESKLNVAIREADYQVSNEFGNVKTIEAKTRLSQHYLSITESILGRLSRIQFSNLTGLLPYPNSDMDVVMVELDKKLNRLRGYLRTVILKIQKLNISFRKIEARTKKLNRLLTAIQNKAIELDVEFVDVNSLPQIFHKVELNGIIPVAHFNAISPSVYEESRFRDIASKLKLNREQVKNREQNKDYVAYQEDEPIEQAEDLFEVQFEQEKQVFVAYLFNCGGSEISLRDYWESTSSLSTLVDVRSWLYEMVNWLGELEQDMDSYEFKLLLIKEPVCEKTDVFIVSDVKTQFSNKPVQHV
ncbi:hypothetical protein [Thiomicrorhabdus sp. 6S3-12]|uniref:hypothetical protein n=1 Tax=Thiomicrorhabdus sp. 6S3-12 TaxID=2819681 RepID=UPI001AAD03F8|nr:hypothetical protein [Thiomicrorhabdus sp. 6S3-12]MBO1924578.1 hypothetical protein [Thiomicrorhabdus sp. 6S3-12]